MLIVDDWLEDWLSEHRNIPLEGAHSMAQAVRDAAFANGYSIDQLRDASNGDIDQFVSRVVAMRLIAKTPVAPLEGAIGRLPEIGG
jgi:hypothetical protein